MKKSNFIMERHFHGDAIEWLNQIPEEVIDKAIQILEIDPNKEYETKKYPNIKADLAWWGTVKTSIWRDLVSVIHRWGMPAPSKLKTSPANLKKHLADIRKKISDAKTVLEKLDYPVLFEKGTMSKEFTCGYDLRQVSEVLRANKESTSGFFASSLMIKQEFDEKGVWKNYFPFDHDRKDAVVKLGSIIETIDKLVLDRRYLPSGRGQKKAAKDDYDNLVLALCEIYKKYTGQLPISSAQEDGTATGKIIPFLKLILDQSHYPFEKTDWALEKKIREMKVHPLHGKLWQVAKK